MVDIKESFMLIKEVPLGCIFVSDSQEVQAIDDYLGQDYPETHSYFVDVKNGDYEQIYLFEGTIPYLQKECFKVR
jgi:hypothetical protein